MNHKVLYLECNSGISGDMTVAALLDLGADRQVLMEALNSLPLSGYSIEIKDVFKSGIRACDFNVILDKKHENHDHDMEYLHGNTGTVCIHHDHMHSDMEHISEEHSHACSSHTHNVHSHECSDSLHDTHSHECSNHTHDVHSHGCSDHAHAAHSHECSDHAHTAHHHQESRNLSDIIHLISAGSLTDRAKALAIRIFTILAQAEASVHGKTIDEVHFHEVGAVDSIVDIVAAAVCIDNLRPDEIVVSTLTDGTGQIRCQHGIIPVPVPAVTAIAANEGLSLKLTDIQGELVTPTGAAIAAAVRTAKKLPDEFQILRTGFGAGKRDYKTTGILRAMLLQSLAEKNHDTVLCMETNIDDCSGEAISYTLQQLMEHGARDAFCIPIYMKKNRPAQLLKVICDEQHQKQLESIIFRNTSTIGIRIQRMERSILERRIFAIETPWGMADIKCCTHETDTYYYPENDSICRLAKENHIGFTEMYNMVQAYARNSSIIR